MNIEYPVSCPLMNNMMVDKDICFDIHMVVDGTTPKDYAPQEIYEHDNYQDICLKCPYHRFD